MGLVGKQSRLALGDLRYPNWSRSENSRAEIKTNITIVQIVPGLVERIRGRNMEPWVPSDSIRGDAVFYNVLCRSFMEYYWLDTQELRNEGIQ
jgi:hypothetical protein